MFFFEILRTTQNVPGNEKELRLGGWFRGLLQGRAQLNARPADRYAITRRGQRCTASQV
jgi:hypothetical protein